MLSDAGRSDFQCLKAVQLGLGVGALSLIYFYYSSLTESWWFVEVLNVEGAYKPLGILDVVNQKLKNMTVIHNVTTGRLYE